MDTDYGPTTRSFIAILLCQETITSPTEDVTNEFKGTHWLIVWKNALISVQVTYKLLRQGKLLSLDDCLRMEFRVSQRMVRHPDFITALGSTSTGVPQWSVKQLKDVSDSDVRPLHMSGVLYIDGCRWMLASCLWRVVKNWLWNQLGMSCAYSKY